MNNLNSTKLNIIQISSMIIVALLLGFIFSDALTAMLKFWEREEYSHGYLIPVISLWMVWQNFDELKKTMGQGSWYGLLLVLLGLFLALVGNMATLYVIVQYAFLITLYGICWAYTGTRGMKILWFPLVYLFFMIPLPNFLYNNLSSELQLISSRIGVAIIRLFDISVNLQGNVIDLGNYQLQVVEACNGLRYLFPLSSFSFLCAYFYKSKLWMRALIFLSSLPITVLMNSFRIGVIGILVEYWGIEMAEGFLHDFEGWIIFIGCVSILFIEMWLLNKLFNNGRDFWDVFVVDVSVPLSVSREKPKAVVKNQYYGLPNTYLLVCLMLLIGSGLTMFSGERNEIHPERKRFLSFPLQIGDWRGIEVAMEQQFIDELKFDDYIIANYNNNKNLPVNLYIAYYASQRKGASAHSPKSCLPGDGWRVENFVQKTIPAIDVGDGKPLIVNSAVISKGPNKQVVYYWFQQRGRIIANEYLVKWYLFWDSLTQQRTDGALVRLVVSIPEGINVDEGYKYLNQFIQEMFPVIEDYIPEKLKLADASS